VIGDQKLQWPTLIAHCRTFLKQYQSKAYEKLFPNYRNFRDATDAEVIALDEILLKRQRPDACNSNPAVPGELPKPRIRGERRQQT